MKNRTIAIFIILFLPFPIYSQNNHFFKIESGESIIDNRVISHLSFSIDTTYKDFHNDILKKFGSPIFEGYTAVFDSVRNLWWSKAPITIRYEVISIRGFEGNWKTIFFMAETNSKEKIDLLIPGKISYRRFNRFLKRKIRKNF